MAATINAIVPTMSARDTYPINTIVQALSGQELYVPGPPGSSTDPNGHQRPPKGLVYAIYFLAILYGLIAFLRSIFLFRQLRIRWPVFRTDGCLRFLAPLLALTAALFWPVELPLYIVWRCSFATADTCCGINCGEVRAKRASARVEAQRIIAEDARAQRQRAERRRTQRGQRRPAEAQPIPEPPPAYTPQKITPSDLEAGKV
ncbi:hypothetical protein PG989_007019 [Apiospora arundinis]